MPKQPEHRKDVNSHFSPYSNSQASRIDLPGTRLSGSRNGTPLLPVQSTVDSVNSIIRLPSFRSTFGDPSLIHSSLHAHNSPSHALPGMNAVVTPLQYLPALQRVDNALEPPPLHAAPGIFSPRGEPLLFGSIYPHLPPLRVPLNVASSLAADDWDRPNRSSHGNAHVHPGITREIQIPSASHQLTDPYLHPPLSPPTEVESLRRQFPGPSQVRDCPQPVYVVEEDRPRSPLADSSVDTTRPGRSFLRNARNVKTGDWHVNHTTVVNPRLADGWKLLQEHTAPSALHDSSARYDAPKCDEDTRVEVITEIMGIIKDRSHPQRILCMTGAAGAGKSALEQSVAKCCEEDGILGCAYFISAADSSRNTASTIVPTIAYQLGLKDPTLRGSIAAAVEHDSLIFTKSLQTQMDILIVRPFESLQSSVCDALPYAILIDGLDECQGDPIRADDGRPSTAKYRSEDRQTELLIAIKNSLLKPNLPFRIFLASRPELAVHTALGPGGSLYGLAYHIPLSNKYDATEDMRRYLRRRFQDIGLRIDKPHWFTEGNIDTLVEAGSGQFVYVATVYKYVSDPRASPVEKLKAVLEWKPDHATRPFEALDMLYRNILLRAKEAYEAVDIHNGRDFLLLLKFFLTEFLRPVSAEQWRYSLTCPDFVTTLLGLESDPSETLILDLRSLVYIEEDDGYSLFTHGLAAYHKSLYEFMDESSRAKDLYVPYDTLCKHLLMCYMQRILNCSKLVMKLTKEDFRSFYDDPVDGECLSHSVFHFQPFLSSRNDVDDELVDFTQKDGWRVLDKLICGDGNFGMCFKDHLEVFYDSDELGDWVLGLFDYAQSFKKRRRKAGKTMRKYTKKWKYLWKELYAGSDSDSDS